MSRDELEEYVIRSGLFPGEEFNRLMIRNRNDRIETIAEKLRHLEDEGESYLKPLPHEIKGFIRNQPWAGKYSGFINM